MIFVAIIWNNYIEAEEDVMLFEQKYSDGAVMTQFYDENPNRASYKDCPDALAILWFERTVRR